MNAKSGLLILRCPTATLALFFSSCVAINATVLPAEEGLLPPSHPAAPTYQILPRPLPKHTGKHLPYSTTNLPQGPAIIEAEPIQTFAYGWFGPRPTPHWVRQFGYGKRYTQWTLK